MSPPRSSGVAPILRGDGSASAEGAERWARGGICRVTAPRGVSTRGVQSKVPAPPKLAQAQPCSFLCLYCFFPLQLVGFLINSQISFGHRSWGWKKTLSEVDFANQHWPSQTSSGGISIGAPNN